jgi:hypothetical protein
MDEETTPAATAPAADEDGPKPDGWGDDALIDDILGDKPSKERRPERERRPRDPEPEPAEEEGDHEPPPAAEDDDEPEQEDEPEPAAEDDEAEPIEGDIAAARAAAEDGDLDKAFMIAFGKKPEQMLPNAHAWTQWRKANAREDAKRAEANRALAAERAQAIAEINGQRQQIHQTIEALRPYEKYYVAEQAFQKDGDPSHLVEIIQGVAKMSYDEAQKIILTKTRRSPAERAMAARLAELEAKVREKDEERAANEQRQTAEQQYAADLAYIRQNVTGDVAKIPRFAERIYRILDQTKGPLGLTLTVEQAAERVRRAELKRVENHPFVKKKPKPGVPAPVRDAARTLASRAARSAPALRRNSQNNGASTAKEQSTDDIVADILRGKPRRSA